MSSGGNEVETTVDASVFQHSTEHSSGFFIQILLILGVYVLDDGMPAAWRREREKCDIVVIPRYYVHVS